MWRSNKTKENLFIAMNSCDELITFDCETTGLSRKKNHIIQIAGKKYLILDTKDGIEFKEIGEFEQYINPGYSLPPKIVELTGITDEFLADKPTEDECFDDICNFFGEPQCLGGWNSDRFDIGFVEAMYERHGKKFTYGFKIDGLEMARDLVPKGDKANNKLSSIAALYGADQGLTFHNAFDDVIATARLIEIFIKEYEELERKEKEKPEVEKKVPVIFSMRYWEGPRGLKRIYINTNIGVFFFDIRNKVWDKKADNPNSLDEVDMESLKRDAFEKAGATDELEFARNLRPKKTKATA